MPKLIDLTPPAALAQLIKPLTLASGVGNSSRYSQEVKTYINVTTVGER